MCFISISLYTVYSYIHKFNLLIFPFAWVHVVWVLLHGRKQHTTPPGLHVFMLAHSQEVYSKPTGKFRRILELCVSQSFLIEAIDTDNNTALFLTQARGCGSHIELWPLVGGSARQSWLYGLIGLFQWQCGKQSWSKTWERVQQMCSASPHSDLLLILDITLEHLPAEHRFLGGDHVLVPRIPRV